MKQLPCIKQYVLGYCLESIITTTHNLTTYSNLETLISFIASLSRRVGQDRN